MKENEPPVTKESPVPVEKPVEAPRYEKPRLRRHDQIDQVRPYGPREI